MVAYAYDKKSGLVCKLIFVCTFCYYLLLMKLIVNSFGYVLVKRRVPFSSYLVFLLFLLVGVLVYCYCICLIFFVLA